MIVCVLLPRFELAVALGSREALAAGPAALAPEPGRVGIGQVNAAAEAAGVVPRMQMGEALARCPALALVPPDPVGVADAWEGVVARLEGIGAQVEADRPGAACFDAAGLAKLHGGPAARLAGVGATDAAGTPVWLDGVVAVVRRAIGVPARIGAGPSRFCAEVAAGRARSRRAAVVGGGGDLASAPISALRARAEVAALVEPLEQLGLSTLGELSSLGAAAVTDRFGPAGRTAHALAAGRDTPLVPREPGERLEESLELAEAASGEQLGRALELLIDRLVARRERRGRTLRAVVIAARLVEGGTWRERVVFREALADPGRMRLALGQRLLVLPAPAELLRLSVERFGPPHQGARALFADAAGARRARLREAVRQARAIAGPDAALRVLEVDPGSRVPERRMVLTPYE